MHLPMHLPPPSTKTCIPGQEIYQRLAKNIQTVVKGQEPSIRKLLAAFFSGGHVLLEDYPGTGKTTLAKALALSVDIQTHSIYPRLIALRYFGRFSLKPQRSNLSLP